MADAILLTDGEAAARLKMVPIRLIRLARAGKVPCIVLPDGEIRFSESDLMTWVEAHKQPAAGGATP